jgi:hypothetical protein
VGGRGRERYRPTDAAKEGKENLFPLPLRVRGRRLPTMPFKTTPFRLFFFMNSA